MDLERVVLQYLAEEEFEYESNLVELVRLHGLEASTGEELVKRWFARGWLERLEQQGTEFAPLVHLTEQAYADLPWLAQVT